jgi:hypothetical protein
MAEVKSPISSGNSNHIAPISTLQDNNSLKALLPLVDGPVVLLGEANRGCLCPATPE